MLKISEVVRSKCPGLRLGCLNARISNTHKETALWQLIHQLVEEKQQLSLDEIKKIPEISTSREAYKALGKEPSRYRLSAEALHRRVIRGLGLYQIHTAVDIINYISLKSGFSIGGYDRNKISGDILLDRGLPDEAFDAIGRGSMNIENLPVFKDYKGAFGSPTSDSERTMIDLGTQQLKLIFLDFGHHETLEKYLDESRMLLEKFVSATDININFVKA